MATAAPELNSEAIRDKGVVAMLRGVDRARAKGPLFFALAALMLLMLAPTSWNANEEEYFQLAHRSVAPEAFHQFDAAFDRSNANFVAKALIGNTIAVSDYERAHYILRIAMALLYAIALTLFFYACEIGVADALLIIALFAFMDQQLLGGEWLFEGVEFKTFSYAFIVAAFAFALRRRWMAALVLSAVATYFHFLVGGFWSAMILLLAWRESEFKRPPWKSLGAYALIVAPIMVLILRDQLGGANAISEPSADIIYSKIRNPHHVAPFESLSSFASTWAPGVIKSFVIAAALAILYRLRMLPRIGFVALAGAIFLLLALVVSFLDRNTYFFGKFYLFRPSSLTLLFAIVTFVILIRSHLNEAGRLVWTLTAVATITYFGVMELKDKIGDLRSPDILPYTRELVRAIDGNSQPSDVVVLEPYQEMSEPYVRLHREISRPTLVSWKLVPANRGEIVRWYQLTQERERLFARGCGDEIALRPKPSLLVVFTPEAAQRVGNCGTEVWRDGDTRLIKVSAH